MGATTLTEPSVTDPMASTVQSDPGQSDPGDGRILFCPFCRECYEGERVCPVHELELVEFQDLPRQAHETNLPAWDEPVLPWDVRFGRGLLGLGAVLLLVAFFMPMVVGTFDDEAFRWTGLDLATDRAKNLWTVPFVAVLYFWILLRRRTPVEMLGTRLVAVLLAIMPAFSTAYTWLNVRRGVEAAHGAIAADLGAGVWVVAAGTVLLLVGGVRFGVMPGMKDEREPPGAAPEEGSRIRRE